MPPLSLEEEAGCRAAIRYGHREKGLVNAPYQRRCLALASLVMASYAASDNWDNTMAPADDETNDRNKKR